MQHFWKITLKLAFKPTFVRFLNLINATLSPLRSKVDINFLIGEDTFESNNCCLNKCSKIVKIPIKVQLSKNYQNWLFLKRLQKFGKNHTWINQTHGHDLTKFIQWNQVRTKEQELLTLSLGNKIGKILWAKDIPK